MCVSAWVAIAQAVGISARPIPAAMPRTSRAGQAADQVDRDGGRDGDADRRQQVHPERRLAERLEDDRRQPAEQHVGREPGRVGGAHQRRDGLELAGVPERDARQQGQRGRPRGRSARPSSEAARRGRLTIRATGST